MNDASTAVLIFFLLLIANGLFAMAEISVVSARKAKLKQLADAGSERAKKTLALASEPNRFLSAVQVGISLIGVLLGVFGGESFAQKLSPHIALVPFFEPHAYAIALTLVVIGITTTQVLVGELIPKRIGLNYPENIAMILGPLVNAFARIVSPAVSALTWLTSSFLGIFGIKEKLQEAPVSDEEVNILIEQGMHAGVFNKTEREMVAGVLELDQLSITALMTPRPKIVFLNLDDPEEANWRKIVSSGHSYFPLYQGNRDQIIGMVAVKALWAHSAIGLSTNLKNLSVTPLIVPETMTAIQLLEVFKKSSKHIAVVTDEFGVIQGLVTLIDVLEAIVGDLPDQGRRDVPAAKQREDGSWLIDASLPLNEFKAMFKLGKLPHEDDADFKTIGGFAVTNFGRIPSEGDHFEHAQLRFEIVDMDRHRVDKLLVSKVAPATAKPKTA